MEEKPPSVRVAQSFWERSPDDFTMVEFVELDDHPFWIGTQAHPEFKSRPDRPAPLFRAFVDAAMRRAEGRNPQLLQLDEVDVGAAG